MAYMGVSEVGGDEVWWQSLAAFKIRKVSNSESRRGLSDRRGRVGGSLRFDCFGALKPSGSGGGGGGGWGALRPPMMSLKDGLRLRAAFCQEPSWTAHG